MFTNIAELLSDQRVHTIKAAVFDGAEKINFKDRTEFSGSVLKQVNGAYDYINRFNRTHSEFKDIHRIDIRDYPTPAVIEALLNAVVHRDYAFSVSILISIFDDRIEIVSIGGLVKGISYDDMMVGVSIQRNEKLANVFYRLSLIESFGTEIQKIMRCYKEFSVKPQITVSDNAFKIILPNSNYHANGLNVSNSYADVILKYLSEKEVITRKEAEVILNVSQASAARILKKLVDAGELCKVGNVKNLRYMKNN